LYHLKLDTLQWDTPYSKWSY